MNNELKIETSRISASQWQCSLVNGEARFTDQLNLRSAKARESFLDRIKAKFPGVDTMALGDELDRLAASLPIGEAEAKAAEPASPARQELFDLMPEESRQTAIGMLQAPDLLRRIAIDIEALGVTGERKIAMLLYLVGTSRLLKKPVSAIIQGPSTSGKSFTVERVSRLFPPEAVFIATDITPNALYYLPDGSLAHKWVVGGERSRQEDDERAEATRALREMLTAGELNKMIPEKNKDGNLETRIIHQDGPIAFCETTTLGKIFDEDANRCLLLQTDERELQTRNILLATAKSRNGKADAQTIILKHHAIQRALEQTPVIIPYADRLAEKFPAARTEARRAFGHLLSVIETVALLHQFQRERQDGCIVATIGTNTAPGDYAIAKALLSEPFGRTLGRVLSGAAARFLDRIKKLPAISCGDSFKTSEVYKTEKAANANVRGWLHELAEHGIAEVVETSRGTKSATWRLLPDAVTGDDSGVLPDLVD